MVVAAIGIVINGLSAWLLMAGQKGDLNVRGAFLHMAGDAGVSLGVVIAGGLIILTGWNWLDPTVSIFISAMIVWGTWRLLREAVNMALDAVPPGVDPAAVRSYLSNLPGVSEVHDLTNASRDKAAKEAMHARAERDPFFGRFRAGARGDAAGDEGDGKQVGRCLSHDTLQYFRGKGQTTLGAGEYRRHEAQCLLLARFYRSPRRSDMSEVEGQADIAGTPSIRRC
jgi:hypothetical protein